MFGEFAQHSRVDAARFCRPVPQPMLATLNDFDHTCPLAPVALPQIRARRAVGWAAASARRPTTGRLARKHQGSPALSYVPTSHVVRSAPQHWGVPVPVGSSRYGVRRAPNRLTVSGLG